MDMEGNSWVAVVVVRVQESVLCDRVTNRYFVWLNNKQFPVSFESPPQPTKMRQKTVVMRSMANNVLLINTHRDCTAASIASRHRVRNTCVLTETLSAVNANIKTLVEGNKEVLEILSNGCEMNLTYARCRQ